MKSYQLIYNTHAGKQATLDGKTGIICGWDDDESGCLIMAVTIGKGWPVPYLANTGMHIVTNRDNGKGYYFVRIKDVISQP